ncbi:MAG: hypothetical protein ABL916_07460 [Burkholderiaceae bacterium]
MSPLDLDDRLAVARRLLSDGVMHVVNDLRDDESAAMAQIKIMLIGGDLRDVLGVSAFHGYQFDFQVKTGRVDLLLFHQDGGVTIVEVKADNADVLAIAVGIGRLHMHSAALPAALPADGQPAYLTRILCAPIAPERSLWLMSACDQAGVRFVHLGSFRGFKAQIDAIKRKRI